MSDESCKHLMEINWCRCNKVTEVAQSARVCALTWLYAEFHLPATVCELLTYFTEIFPVSESKFMNNLAVIFMQMMDFIQTIC